MLEAEGRTVGRGGEKSEAVEKGGGKKQETTGKQERIGKTRSWWRQVKHKRKK